MVSTYPIEVLQAERWVNNQNLKEDALEAAAEKQDWDASVLHSRKHDADVQFYAFMMSDGGDIHEQASSGPALPFTGSLPRGVYDYASSPKRTTC